MSDRAALYVKVFAIGAMALDHIDTCLLHGGAGWHLTIGRVVFPIFAVLLAVNLARIPDNAKLFFFCRSRRAWRFFGLLAAVPYIYVYGWLPLNIMFTLAASMLVVAFIRDGSYLLAFVLFAFAGLFVDYTWRGLAAVVGGWWAIRYSVPLGVIALGVGAVLLPVNGNAWAMLAAPLFVVGAYVDGDAPRARWLFYAFHPAHLAVLAIAKSIGV